MSAPAFVQHDLFERPPMLRDRPAVSSVPLGPMVLRDYQVHAIEAIERELSTKRSTLLVLATGGGKTVIFSEIARKRGGALVIAHRDSLIQQAAQKLRHVTGQYVAIEKAERRDTHGANFVVASVQTLRGDRLKFFAQAHRHIGTLIIDECHRAAARSYVEIIAAFPWAKVLGVTATADRGDKKALGAVFDKADTEHGAAFRYDILEATTDAWLTPIEAYPLNLDGVKLDEIGTKGGDIDQDELDREVAKIAGAAAKGMHGKAQGLRSIGFTPGVQTALVAAEALNEIVPGCARAIHGEMGDDEKAQIIAGHKRGEFPYLLNCAVLIEGYDDPELRCVFLFGKTKSRARWAQQAGRVTRLWPHGIDHLGTVEERRAAIVASPKPTALLYDAHYGKSHRHTLAGARDLLSGKYGEEVKKKAQEIMDTEGGEAGAILERAKAIVDAENAAKVKRLAAKAARARGAALTGAALTACQLFGVSEDMGEETFDQAPPARISADDAAWLEAKGVKNAATMTGGAARKLIGEMKRRARAGLATFKMVRMLTKAGVPNANALTFDAAGPLCSVVSAAYDRHDWNFRFPAEMFEPGWAG